MHLRHHLIVTIIAVVYMAAASNVEPNENISHLIVELPTNGKLRGKENDHYYSYESIPYAEPPVGELRFEAPKLYTRKWDHVFDATRPVGRCMQWDQFKEGENKLHGEEDCLTVNIYKPKVTNSSGTNERFPVVVLIHGGAFMFGSLDDNNHERFMRSGQVIVVKMAYRLGPLGFLSTEDAVIPGNFGLKDQRLALHWIKENIANFGGDPENMILVGFSAGGASVHLQMLQQNFTNDFKAAASFSGTAFNPWVILRNSRARAIELAKSLNCTSVDSSDEIKKCLKEKPAEDIVASVRQFLVFGYNPFTTFGPVIESDEGPDAFLVRSPAEVIRSGQFSQIPWLTSYAKDDGGYNAAELLQKSPRQEELIEIMNERWYDLAPYNLFFKDSVHSIEELDNHSSALKKRYLGDKKFSVETYHDVQRMYTDVLFKNGAEQAVHLQREHSSSPVYAYVYDNPGDEGIGTSLAKRKDIELGTNHGDDFFLIFHNPARSKTLRPDEQQISKKFIKMLEDFVKNNTKLSYGSCQFVNNVGGSKEFNLMFITQNACENQNLKNFP